MRKIHYRCLIVALLLGLGMVQAQSSKTADLTKRLYVGDSFVPPVSVQLIRGLEKRIDWKQLEDKVVLLDFFDTSCATCIQTMPKLQRLKDLYPDKFEVITVTWQDRNTMTHFFSKNTFLKEQGVNLSVIYSDSYLKGLFPHQTVPHAVLLYKGKVKAITSSGFITEENILKLHQNESIQLPLKDDYGRRDLLANQSSDSRQFKLGTIITDYQDGVPYRSWKFELDSVTGLYKSSIYNASLFTALKAIVSKGKLNKSNYIPRMDRVIWKVRDSTIYYDFAKENDWRIRHGICYERYDAIQRNDSVQAQIVREDLEDFFGVRVYEGTYKMKVLSLISTDIKPYKAPKGVEAMVYLGTTVFAGFTDLSEEFPPIVDGVKSELEIKIYPYKSLEQLNEQLASYGIKAVHSEKEIEVLFIEEI